MLAVVDILHPVEVRVLGALLEKDITTPEYYPPDAEFVTERLQPKIEP